MNDAILPGNAQVVTVPTPMIKAIQTTYRGYKFRSRLEARWAVYLDQIGWSWEYEPEGYDLGDGMLYLPDFLLRSSGGDEKAGAPMLWLEVKAIAPTEQEREKARRLVAQTQIPMVFCIGIPDPKTLSQGLRGYADVLPGGVCEAEASIDAYCFCKWGRPGWFMGGGSGNEPQDHAACAAARSAKFEHGDRAGMAAI